MEAEADKQSEALQRLQPATRVAGMRVPERAAAPSSSALSETAGAEDSQDAHEVAESRPPEAMIERELPKHGHGLKNWVDESAHQVGGHQVRPPPPHVDKAHHSNFPAPNFSNSPQEQVRRGNQLGQPQRRGLTHTKGMASRK